MTQGLVTFYSVHPFNDAAAQLTEGRKTPSDLMQGHLMLLTMNEKVKGKSISMTYHQLEKRCNA